MTHDGMRGVDLEYNSLNLIRKVKQGNTANATYRWLADGTKAGVVDNNGNGFEYLGSFVYVRDVAGLNLESTSFGGGRFVASSTGELAPYYHITDHLGSVRVVFDKNYNVVAQNDYYAFGLRHENPNLAQHTSNRYLYNGKEEQTTGNVDLLDYGARMYDATLGIWHSVDPMAEKRFWQSPFAFCSNNPIVRVDLNGMIDWGAFWSGLGQTLLGAGSVAVGVIWSGGTAGIGAALGGAALIGGGIGSVALGMTKLVGGLTSDGSERMTKTIESLPTSLPDIGGIAIDAAMGNENEEARNIVKIAEGVTGLLSPSTGFKIFDAVSAVNDLVKVAEGATELKNAIDTSSDSTMLNTNDNTNKHRNDWYETNDIYKNGRAKYGYERDWGLLSF